MNISDGLMILAVMLAPLVSVQVSQLLERRRGREERKLNVFRTLMATRANRVSLDHVKALNMIDLEFSGKGKGERVIRENWKALLDSFTTPSSPENYSEALALKRIDLLVDLLYHMGNFLGYHYDKTHIKNACYSPQAHGELDQDITAIRKGLASLLQGRTVLPMFIANLPSPVTEQPDTDRLVANAGR